MSRLEFALIRVDESGNVQHVLTPEEWSVAFKLLGYVGDEDAVPKAKVPHSKGVLLSPRSPKGLGRRSLPFSPVDMDVLLDAGTFETPF